LDIGPQHANELANHSCNFTGSKLRFCYGRLSHVHTHRLCCHRIRQIISINLPLGLIVVLIGASGRFWG